MKNMLAWVACLVLAAPALGKGVPFSIRGTIDGLQKGDTLLFQETIYPNFEQRDAFFVLVGARGSFHYRGVQEHATNYLMCYKPLAGAQAPAADRLGQTVFVGQGDRLTMQGKRNAWAFCRIKGGVYDHPTYARICVVEDSLGSLRSSYMQKLNELRARKAFDESARYADLFNNARTYNKESDSLWAAYMADPTAGEILAVKMLGGVTSTPIDRLEQSYNALSPAIKQSYYGEQLGGQVANVVALAPGRVAPDFTLINDQGTVGLGDFRGKYLLIYCWGACPGSIRIDPWVQGLWREVDTERVAFVAVTEGRSTIEQINATAGPTDSLYGANIKINTGGMLAHPFPDYDLNREENKRISTDFAFGGLPYFVLIDPEGEIAGRGFHDVFSEAQKILPRKQTVKGDE